MQEGMLQRRDAEVFVAFMFGHTGMYFISILVLYITWKHELIVDQDSLYSNHMVAKSCTANHVENYLVVLQSSTNGRQSLGCFLLILHARFKVSVNTD